MAVEKGIGEYVEGGSVYRKIVGFDSALSGGIISTNFLKNHPDQAKKFLNAMKRSIDFRSSHS
jgi:ABC-type nitrate/sulfonate/bicarbonate transport system substrate-binding protein